MVEERRAPEPVIVKKGRSKGHRGHHGGAWKVAYADFVTAMMAFFLVLWLVSQDDSVKENVAGYFRDPVTFGQGAGILEGAGAVVPGPAPSPAADAETQQKLELARQAAEARVREKLAAAGRAIRELLDGAPDLGTLSSLMEIEMTDEGLRIQMIEPGKNEAFFRSGSAELDPRTRRILDLIASELRKLPNHIVLEGHTDSLSFAAPGRYSNWQLSADRANSARAELEAGGLPTGQIREIRGYAANRPRFRDDPGDPRNRRISILVLNDYSEFIRGPITVGGRTFVYREGLGYRERDDPGSERP